MASYFETRYLAPTNTRGARVKVIQAGSGIALTVSNWDYAATNPHRKAVEDYAAAVYAGAVEVAFATERGYVFRVGA